MQTRALVEAGAYSWLNGKPEIFDKSNVALSSPTTLEDVSNCGENLLYEELPRLNTPDKSIKETFGIACNDTVRVPIMFRPASPINVPISFPS